MCRFFAESKTRTLQVETDTSRAWLLKPFTQRKYRENLVTVKFSLPLEQIIRIRTGETGAEAI